MSSQAAQRPQLPADRLIVLGSSIGPVSLGEPRATVRRALGPGKRTIRGVFLYFGGRLRVSYWFHDAITQRVSYVETKWDGFHARSGVRVGTTRRRLRLLGAACSRYERICSLPAGTGPDAPGTFFGTRAGKVARIAVSYG